MSSEIITQVIEEMNDLPDDLQQRVLEFIEQLRQQHLQPPGSAWEEFIEQLRQEHLQPPGSAWDVLESLTGTVEAPADWSAEHDHYLYGTVKRQSSEL